MHVIGVNACSLTPCEHDGVCYGTEEEDYLCVCKGDYYGETCSGRFYAII